MLVGETSIERKKLVVGDLRILAHKDGGYLVIIAPHAPSELHHWEERPITTDIRVKDWPKDWPTPKGMNEMWMQGQDQDKNLIVTMLGGLFQDIDFEIYCTDNLNCPEGCQCESGECVET